MRKNIVFLMLLSSSLLLGACGGNNNNPTPKPSDPSSEPGKVDPVVEGKIKEIKG